MDNQRYIYVVFSSTPLKMGTLIRKVTGEKYNHVSISIDPKLSILYSFARRYINTPFYGGFVRESFARYKLNERIANVKVCAVPVTDLQYFKVCRYLFEKNSNQDQYIYNMISAMFTPLHKKIYINNAYTCIEFVVDIISKCGICDEIDESDFYSLTDLQTLLGSYIVYEGVFLNSDFESGSLNDNYYLKKNIAVRAYLTVSANAGLVYKLIKTKVK